MLMMSNNTNEFEISESPRDGISAVKFGPFSDTLLLASSWDGTLYLYDAMEGKAKARFPFDQSPALLDCCFGYNSSAVAYTAGLQGSVIQVDLGTIQHRILGSHSEAVKCMTPCKETGLLFTGSWDRSIAGWDSRAGSACRISGLPGRVYSMDCSHNILVAAMSDRHVHIYDTRKTDQPLQRRESSLKYQTRAVASFPSGEGYVCTSIEGRVAVEFIDPSDAVQSGKYAFKCHRAPSDTLPNMEMVFPVNAVSFHPTYGTFATGGSDGMVNFWDRVNRKRIRQVGKKYPSGISSLSFNRDGQLLAIASSYGYEEGERE